MLKIHSKSDVIFDSLNAILLIIISFLCLYPMLYVIFASLSDPGQLTANRGMLLKPLGFTLEGYKLIFKDNVLIHGFLNTFFYIITGVSVNMIFTIMGAYVLSRKKTMIRKSMTVLVTFTMFFGGGLIPFFMLVKDLGMYNSWTALVFPFAINTWNMIILRIGFDAFPRELEEAAIIDGANDFYVFSHLLLPLSQAVLAVILLYYVVGAWNSWFPAMIFIKERSKFPVQLLLREILIITENLRMKFLRRFFAKFI